MISLLIPARSAGHPIHLVLGFSAWALWFTVLYGALSVACAVAPPAAGAGPWTGLNAALLLFTAATAAALTAAAWAARGAARRLQAVPAAAGREAFLATGAAALYLAAAICTVVVGVPLLLLPPCL